MSKIKPYAFNDVQNTVYSKADKATQDASSFGLFGLRVPKMMFTDKKALERIEKNKEIAEQMLRDAAELLAKAFRPLQS